MLMTLIERGLHRWLQDCIVVWLGVALPATNDGKTHRECVQGRMNPLWSCDNEPIMEL